MAPRFWARPQRPPAMRRLSLFAALVLAAPLWAGASAAQPGFGFTFTAGADGLVVQAVAPDGSAAGAGIKAQDVITAVGGRSMAGVSLDAAGVHLASFTAPPRSAGFDVRRGGIRFSALIYPTEFDRVALGGSGTPPRALPVPAGTGCVAGDCTDGTGSYRYDSGATYVGGWQGGRRHGRGTYTFTTGMTFVGDWRDGARVRGRETFPSGSAYEGDYADDERHGQGTYTFASGAVYTDAFADNKMSGTGRYTWPSGSVYEGEFLNEKRHGQGTMRHHDGRVESGTWRDGAFVGGRAAPVASGACAQTVPILQARSAEQVRCALAAGGDPDAVGDRGVTPLYIAVDRNDSASLRLLHQAGADVNAPAGPLGSPVLFSALLDYETQPETIETLLALGARVDARNGSEWTPLHTAVMQGHVGGIRLLLAAGADPNARTELGAADGTTPLHMALYSSTKRDVVDIVAMLLEAGADPARRDEAGETAFDYATSWPDGPTRSQVQAALRASTSAPSTPPATSATGCVSGDCADGTGTARYANGDTYEGAFAGGRRHGRGTYTWASGESATGDWVRNDLARGVRRYTDGAVYDGEIQNWKRHGQGTMTYAGGQVYTGGWAESLRHGHGSMTYGNGNVYTGGWLDDDRHGQGTLVFPNGESFVGDWAGNAAVRGRETYPSGSTYDGEYQDGKRHGTGRFTWTSGSVYEGQFADGKRHGQGTMRHADGRVETGEWRDDAFVGRSGPTPRVTEILTDG